MGSFVRIDVLTDISENLPQRENRENNRVFNYRAEDAEDARDDVSGGDTCDMQHVIAHVDLYLLVHNISPLLVHNIAPGKLIFLFEPACTTADLAWQL